jgi:gamma-glutamyl-gamma-aminobutyrate hydrolase PuuD
MPADRSPQSDEPGGRPLIGLTTSTRDVKFVAGAIRSSTVGRNYVNAVWDAGGLPILLPTLEAAAAAAALGACSGLVLIGGGDVDPALYGEERHPKTYEVDPERDAFEIALARAAIDRDMPVLGICRGAQILNVTFGGSLQQDLTGDCAHHWTGGFEPAHMVALESDSRVGAAHEVSELKVNSLHHQAIGRLGQGLRATAWSEDGVIEAVEHDAKWVVAVQWHPEVPPAASRGGDVLLHEFVREAKGNRG